MKHIEKATTLYKYLAFPGQLRETLAGLFDEVWIMEKNQVTKGGRLVTEHTLRTVPNDFRDAALGLKTAVGIDSKFPLDFNKLQTMLAK